MRYVFIVLFVIVSNQCFGDEIPVSNSRIQLTNISEGKCKEIAATLTGQSDQFMRPTILQKEISIVVVDDVIKNHHIIVTGYGQACTLENFGTSIGQNSNIIWQTFKTLSLDTEHPLMRAVGYESGGASTVMNDRMTCHEDHNGYQVINCFQTPKEVLEYKVNQ